MFSSKVESFAPDNALGLVEPLLQAVLSCAAWQMYIQLSQHSWNLCGRFANAVVHETE